ncbi:MAG: L,D-transpeptidase family protein [Verrucomicrobiales bacterium]|nr:L,D-transpeptidase family protein [Verrucomicrobiales bacterium]
MPRAKSKVTAKRKSRAPAKSKSPAKRKARKQGQGLFKRFLPVVLFIGITWALFAPITEFVSAQGFFKPKIAPEPGEDESEVVTRVQIYLDRKQFGPGVIDGALGEFTRLAVSAYNTRYVKKPDPNNWYQVLRDSQLGIKYVYTKYTIKKGDLRYVGRVPRKLAQQEGMKYMYYRSLAEFVTERYHTNWKFLHKLNPGVNLDRLKPGDILSVPNVVPFQIEDIKNHDQYPEEALLSQRHLLVNTTTKIVSILENDQVIATFPITPGKEKFIPRGEWKIINMVATPEFRYDRKMLNEGVRSDHYYTIPPGPNNPVGILWAGLSKSGIGLHGTNNPDTIGRARSAGCIRLANWDAIRLPTLVRPGATVTVK